MPKKVSTKKKKSSKKKKKKVNDISANDFNIKSKAKTRCYVIRNDNNKRMIFQFNPSSLQYSRTAKYNTVESPGMCYPITQYVGGDVREFSFEVFYYDNPSTGGINRARTFLEGLLPPEKNKKGYKKPPTFTFAYGYFVRVCVLKQLDVNDEWLDENGKPIMSRFTLTVRQVKK